MRICSIEGCERKHKGYGWFVIFSYNNRLYNTNRMAYNQIG